MKRNLRTLIQDRQTPHSFRMDKKDSPYEIFSLFSEKDEPTMKSIIGYVLSGAFFGKCHDLLFKRNEYLFESKTTEGVYFNDLQKYFQRSTKIE